MTPEERLAVLETEFRIMKSELQEMRGDVRTIRDTLLQAKGGWKLFMMVGGFSAAVGAFIGKFLPYFWKV